MTDEEKDILEAGIMAAKISKILQDLTDVMRLEGRDKVIDGHNVEDDFMDLADTHVFDVIAISRNLRDKVEATATRWGIKLDGIDNIMNGGKRK